MVVINPSAHLQQRDEQYGIIHTNSVEGIWRKRINWKKERWYFEDSDRGFYDVLLPVFQHGILHQALIAVTLRRS